MILIKNIWMNFIFNIRKIILVVFIGLCFSCSSEKEKEVLRLEGFVFGTTYHITFLDDSSISYQKSIDSLFDSFNSSLSTYLPTSAISKINKGDTTIVLDPYFREVLQKSKRIFKETDGFFDPTVGNLVNVWGFGPEKTNIHVDSALILKKMKLVGLDKISLEKGKLKKEYPGVYLDFNSIAKGFGVDVLGRFLESKNCTNYLVEIGGEIRARGKNAKGKQWRVAIENPNTDGTQTFYTTVALSNESMATSGNYRKYRITDSGQKYVHTVNPKTGFATESNLLSATVISELDCADVDAYATAFMAMGVLSVQEFLKTHTALKVLLIYVDDDGNIEEFKNF